MATIEIMFRFSSVRAGGDTEIETVDLDVGDSLVFDIECAADEWLDDWNDKLPEGSDPYELDAWSVSEYDNDFADPRTFRNLSEYGAYVEQCELHGEGYRLRYDDIGEHNFDNEYNGCWASTEEFVQQFYEDCYDIPSHLQGYIDWAAVTRDVMMDFSAYEGDDGIHIFRD